MSLTGSSLHPDAEVKSDAVFQCWTCHKRDLNQRKGDAGWEATLTVRFPQKIHFDFLRKHSLFTVRIHEVLLSLYHLLSPIMIYRLKAVCFDYSYSLFI